MEEKKLDNDINVRSKTELSDEEIVKDIERSTGMQSYWKKIVLDLIHRLQAENETQRKIIEYQDGLPDLVEQQKAEIERLKKRHGVVLLRNDDLDLENYELKKQVDELTRKAAFYYKRCKSYGIECFYDETLEGIEVE